MRILSEHGATLAGTVAEHGAVAGPRPVDRASVRLNMICSPDGDITVNGVSGGLGNRHDHAAFRALREKADAVRVWLAAVVPQRGSHLPLRAGQPAPGRLRQAPDGRLPGDPGRRPERQGRLRRHLRQRLRLQIQGARRRRRGQLRRVGDLQVWRSQDPCEGDRRSDDALHRCEAHRRGLTRSR